MASAGSDSPLYIGVDIGTGSVRAALVTHTGEVVASATKDTQTFRDENDHRIFEQSTKDIWDAICSCVQKVIGGEDANSSARIDPARVLGIGFDATCSLAVTDTQGNPITVSKGSTIGTPGERNIILWADHRAEEEANLINSAGSVVLDYVGGKISVSQCIVYRFNSDYLDLLLLQTKARDGNSEDLMAEEAYAQRIVFAMSVL